MRTQRLCREDSTDRIRALVLPGLFAPDQTGAADHLTARAQAPPRMSPEFARHGLCTSVRYVLRYADHRLRNIVGDYTTYPPTRGALARVLNGRTR